ncbi:MAG: hypothetical protein LBE86_06000, partial [Gemmobacter sp.]|nr:hypothetical protein [Gemmobacter sp.]
ATKSLSAPLRRTVMVVVRGMAGSCVLARIQYNQKTLHIKDGGGPIWNPPEGANLAPNSLLMNPRSCGRSSERPRDHSSAAFPRAISLEGYCHVTRQSAAPPSHVTPGP